VVSDSLRLPQAQRGYKLIIQF